MTNAALTTYAAIAEVLVNRFAVDPATVSESLRLDQCISLGGTKFSAFIEALENTLQIVIPDDDLRQIKSLKTVGELKTQIDVIVLREVFAGEGATP